MPPNKPQTQKIHIAIKQLGLTDDVYRDILQLNFKVESSKQLNSFQADKLLDILKTKGFKIKRSAASKLSPKYSNAAHCKIVAMWITMAKKKIIRNATDRALQAYVKRTVHVDNLKWCGGEECRVLIESLKSWGRREGVDV